MSGVRKDEFAVLEPKLQIAFFYALKTLRELYFGKALAKVVAGLDIGTIDKELERLVGKASLSKVASFGLRGEVVFPVPCLVRRKPSLLGYYRLLYGLSQKEFYNKGPFGQFKVLEEKSELPERLDRLVEPLCRSLITTGEKLVEGIDLLSRETVDDLQLLTLGPQLRGSANTRIGKDATRRVFELIHEIVRPYVKKVTSRTISIKNDSKTAVEIRFGSDPDTSMTACLPTGDRPLVSIEIKGGADASNVHNRLGEAEKSHQKAKKRGFFEFWTVLRVEVDQGVAKRESPTTSHVFNLDKITTSATSEHRQFKDLLSSVMGIGQRQIGMRRRK